MLARLSVLSEELRVVLKWWLESWGGGSVVKALAIQARGCQVGVVRTCNLCLEGRDEHTLAKPDREVSHIGKLWV